MTIDSELQAAGINPEEWQPVERAALNPSGAPPATNAKPPLYIGSLPVGLQHDSTFTGTKYGNGVPTTSLMPLSPSGVGQNNAASQTISKIISQETISIAAVGPTGAIQFQGGGSNLAGTSLLSWDNIGFIFKVGGDETVTGDLNIGGDVDVAGDFNLTGNVVVTGNVTAMSLLGLTGALTPKLAGGIPVGSAALPFSGIYIGAAATDNALITGTFTGARTVTLPDANSNTVQPLGAAGSHEWVAYIDDSGVQNLSQPNFTDLTGSIAIGQTPLTTLGDLLYADATPALQRLAGNTSATKKYLSQTGTGVVSAAPAWEAIAATDVEAAGSTGQVQFNGNPLLDADSNFFWDNTNKRLGIGNSSPASALSIGSSSQFQVSSGGMIAEYGGVATVSGGVPVVVAKSLLTAQSAAITATTVYAVPSDGAGFYRISWEASITTVDSTLFTLGGSNGFQIKFENGNGDSATKTSNPTTPTVSATNSTGTTIGGVVTGYAAASSNLQYLFGYTVGTGDGRYDLSIFVEYLGA